MKETSARRGPDSDSLHAAALASVLLLATFLDCFRLGERGFPNIYYAAAVRSMLESSHAFLYAALDPGGYVAVDKPPLGLWIQAAFARLFGFGPITVLLPQTVSGALSVVVLYALVRRSAGRWAGLLAALFLTLSPVSVVANRSNNVDSLLVLAVLLAACCVSIAAGAGSLRLLALGALLVGLGFNIKMLQAYLVVPALGITYLVGAPIRLWTRVIHLALAALVLCIVSTSWIALVDTTPAANRPFVGSSTNNTEWNLLTGYNGLGRLFGISGGATSANAGVTASPAPVSPGFGSLDTGLPDPYRLLNDQLGGQIGWMLVPALFGLMAAARGAVRRRTIDRQSLALLLWGAWCLTGILFFSAAQDFHAYYLSILAPAVAALAGIGIPALWHEFQRPEMWNWLLPVALAAGAVVQVHLLGAYPGWGGVLTLPILVLCGAVVISLVVVRPRPVVSGPERTGGTLRSHAQVSSVAQPAFRPPPVWLSALVIVPVFFGVGIAVLYAHSPLRYSAHYASPSPLLSIYGRTAYGAVPHGRGWDILTVSNRSRLVFARFGARDGLSLEQSIGQGDDTSRPSLAEGRQSVMGAWVAHQGQTVEAAYLNAGPVRPLALVPDGGIAEHPYVLATSRGFVVLFDWQRPGTEVYGIYGAWLQRDTPGVRLVQLVHAGPYALSPRAVVDGSGAIDMLYLKNTGPGFWQVRFARFSPDGSRLGGEQGLGTISYLFVDLGGCRNPNVVPQQWAMDMKRGSDGSIWAAWETGSNCVSPGVISGDNVLYIGRWSRHGDLMVRPKRIDGAVDPNDQTVALALTSRNAHAYYVATGVVQSYIVDTAFTLDGRHVRQERVNYDGGGRPGAPDATAAAGVPAVVWEKDRVDDTSLVTVTFHRAQAPDLTTRLGLNVGNIWVNSLLVVFGALAAGIGLTLINLALLLPLVPAWFTVQHMAHRRDLAFQCAIAIWLIWLFVLNAGFPVYVLGLEGLAGPGGIGRFNSLMAVGGSIVVSAWVGRVFLARREGAVRAAGIAFAAMYFVTVMEAVMFVESQITRI